MRYNPFIGSHRLLIKVTCKYPTNNVSDVGTFSCADSDVSTGTFGALTYSIETGDTLAQFTVNDALNKLQTHSSNGIDYDSGNTFYEIVIKIVDNDSGTPKNSATVTAVVVVGIVCLCFFLIMVKFCY